MPKIFRPLIRSLPGIEVKNWERQVGESTVEKIYYARWRRKGYPLWIFSYSGFTQGAIEFAVEMGDIELYEIV